MKYPSIYFAVFSLFATLLLPACQVGVSKDLTSGLTYTYKGLGAEEVYLFMNDAEFDGNEFPFGNKVYMQFSGVSGFKARDGKIFPGMSIQVKDATGATILDSADLFTEFEDAGIDQEMSKELHGNITIGEPMTEGSEYTWTVKIWDKNGEGTIDAVMKFVVTPPS